MGASIQSIRGMNDFLPAEMATWHRVEAALRQVASQYGYRELRTPMLENTELFKQSIGDATDIVEKEMYTFSDSDASVSLRPEATASTVRALLQHGLLHNQQQRIWYMGPMFRRERPQKGRYRQFHQFGIEAFGWQGPDIDAEIIRVGERIWRSLDVTGIRLNINTLGSEASRARYREALVTYLSDYREELDEDSQRRLGRSPLRILDSKHPRTREIVAGAPNMPEFLDAAESEHFGGLCAFLDDAGIAYDIDPRLVRGLDYYTSTVFEWRTDQLGAQDAVCAGGRYDRLVQHRGGRDTPAIGFAMGLERLVELLRIQGDAGEQGAVDVYAVSLGNAAGETALVAETLRDHGLNVLSHCGGGKPASRFRKADQSGARYAIVIGDDEVAAGVVQVKPLRETADQVTVPRAELVGWMQAQGLPQQ